MAIKTSCSCGFSFSAKDELAGRKVKCPRCQGVISVPSESRTVKATAGAPQINKKLLDLLDDAGVKSTPKGPICAACGEEMAPTAVICISCGYNVATGQYLETYTDNDYQDDELSSSKLTDAEKALARAEREIADSPIGAEDQDFGDGADSYIIAMAGFAIFGVILLLGLGVVLIMDSLTDSVSPGIISAIASTVIYVGCAIWITFVAFKIKPGQAIACIFTGGLFCPIFGILQGRGTIAAAVIMIVSAIIGGASWLYCYNTGLLSG